MRIGKRKKAHLKEKILELYEASGCNVSSVCKRVGIARKTFYEWKKEDKEFTSKLEEIEDGLIDYVETALMKQIKEGQLTAIIFYLKTKGKDRGYTERVEHKIDEDAGIEIVIHNPNDDKEEEE